MVWTDPETGRQYELGPDGQPRWVDVPPPPAVPPPGSRAPRSTARTVIGVLMVLMGVRGFLVAGDEGWAVIIAFAWTAIGVFLIVSRPRMPASWGQRGG